MAGHAFFPRQFQDSAVFSRAVYFCSKINDEAKHIFSYIDDLHTQAMPFNAREGRKSKRTRQGTNASSPLKGVHSSSSISSCPNCHQHTLHFMYLFNTAPLLSSFHQLSGLFSTSPESFQGESWPTVILQYLGRYRAQS